MSHQIWWLRARFCLSAKLKQHSTYSREIYVVNISNTTMDRRTLGLFRSSSSTKDGCGFIFMPDLRFYICTQYNEIICYLVQSHWVVERLLMEDLRQGNLSFLIHG